MANEGKVKGTLLLSRMKYLRANGAGAVRAALGRLPPADRDVLDGMLLLPACWYPAEILKRLDEAIATSLAGGERTAILLDVGQFSADHNLGPSGVLRAYLREDDPHALLREVPRIHASLHGGTERRYEWTGERSAVVRSARVDGREGDDCLTTVGWLKRAIELCGGRDVQVLEARCLSKGAPCCEFRCEWH
jgi:uncharacterized protein (TIGR02265 family)